MVKPTLAFKRVELERIVCDWSRKTILEFKSESDCFEFYNEIADEDVEFIVVFVSAEEKRGFVFDSEERVFTFPV